MQLNKTEIQKNYVKVCSTWRGLSPRVCAQATHLIRKVDAVASRW